MLRELRYTTRTRSISIGLMSARSESGRASRSTVKARRETRLEHSQAGGLDDFQRRNAGVAQSIDAAERFGIGADELCQRAELAQQRLGPWLGVAAWDRQREQIFDQFSAREGARGGPHGRGEERRVGIGHRCPNNRLVRRIQRA